jgi:DNA-directed RNA polymerase specialized sigma subunit
VLNETEGALPSRGLSNNAAVDASLRQNLRTINEFIAECEARLKQNPQDQLTREYLNMAYQQKADLLNAMMDSGRSEH